MKPSDTISKLVSEKPTGTVLPRGSSSGPPQIKREPHCLRCGTSVEKGVDYCEVCEEIVAQQKPPQATIIIVREGAGGEAHREPKTESGDLAHTTSTDDDD